MSNILILGGTGFLGCHLSFYLQSKGFNVFVYSRNIHSLEYSNVERVTYMQGDFSHENSFDKILDGIDVIFHLISTTKPENKNAVEEFQNNVIPSIRLLDTCVKKKIRIIYFSSGGTVYGIPRYLPIDEGHRTEPISLYGIQKLSIEKCLEYYGWMYGLNYTILRISNPYGPLQNPNGNQGVISVFLARAIMDSDIHVWGDGSVVRDYIYVDDVMRACIALLDYDGNTHIFNLGSGLGYSIKEILYLIEQKLGKPLSIIYSVGRKQDVPTNILSSQLLMKECHWHCGTSLEAGINRMLMSWDEETSTFRKWR